MRPDSVISYSVSILKKLSSAVNLLTWLASCTHVICVIFSAGPAIPRTPFVMFVACMTPSKDVSTLIFYVSEMLMFVRTFTFPILPYCLKGEKYQENRAIFKTFLFFS